jgi:Phage integrase, N-terminal SAM-like domain
MVRPLGRPLARRDGTLEDLREEFLAHCEARNLSGRTLQWYADRTRRFADWCSDRGISASSDFRWSDLEEFVLDRRRKGFAPNTVHGYAQVLKTLRRLGHRIGCIPRTSPRTSRCPGSPRPSSRLLRSVPSGPRTRPTQIDRPLPHAGQRRAPWGTTFRHARLEHLRCTWAIAPPRCHAPLTKLPCSGLMRRILAPTGDISSRAWARDTGNLPYAR